MKLHAAFWIVLILAILMEGPAFAEKFESPENGFSIDPLEPWKKIPQAAFQGGVVSYALEGSTALFHVTVRDLEKAKSVAEYKWEDLFSPQFGEILIGTEGETLIGGEKAKYCVYRIKPGAFKTQMEGNIPAKYINYILPRGNKLFSVTFVDTLDGFSLDYSSFLTAIRTIHFGEIKPLPAAPKVSETVPAAEKKPLDFKKPEAP